VTLTAIVGSDSGTPIGGSGTIGVVFMDGTNQLAGTVIYSTIDGKLVVTLVTNSLAVGSHVITAKYSGSGFPVIAFIATDSVHCDSHLRVRQSLSLGRCP
jgi:hypothetical protein